MIRFPSESVKAALLSKPDDPMHFFREALAEALPASMMTGAAFALRARMLLFDRPGRLSGYPPAIYASVAMCLPALAREVLPPDVGEDIAIHLETT